MGHAISVTVRGKRLSVDGRDVGDAEGMRGRPEPRDPVWRQAAERYVDANPRVIRRLGETQRLQITRTLAAGPADTATLLRAMRAAGWVGASDLENRLRDLAGKDTRGIEPHLALQVRSDGDIHRLAEPFPAIDGPQRTAVGYLKTLTGQQEIPLAVQALQVLDGVLPGVGAHSGQRGAPTMRLPADDLRRFEQAREERRPVEVVYHSMNSGRVKTYLLVPVEYIPAGPAMKAVCVEVDADGMPGRERQFALDRIHAVRDSGLDPLPAEALTLQREILHLVVTGDLYKIMHGRNQFNIREFDALELDVEDGTWEVRGTFPTALAWDVMEQMCAWAGSVVIHEPLWLVHAVFRRMHAGIAAMEDHTLVLVKPEPTRVYARVADALLVDEDLAAQARPAGPRKLLPPGS